MPDYLDAWHKQRSPFLPDGTVAQSADLHPSTWMHDESVIRFHLKPAFGDLRIDELSPIRCKDFRKSLQDKKLSGKTAGNILGVLHKAMADAVEDGTLQANPVPKLTRHRRRSVTRSNSDPLTVAEVKPAAASSSKMFVGEGAARAALQVALELERSLIILEADRDDQRPRYMLRGVRGTACVVLPKSLLHIGAHADVVLGGVASAAE